jgi:glycosyltransferase involved in cell wall biosynthesis
VILTVSRLTFSDRYKGIEHLIEAMPAILKAEPAARLRVVGRGEDMGRLQGLVRDRGLTPKTVEFLGFLDDRRLDAELRSCRIFALPSKSEGFGLVFLEAMAHGRPCVGAREGGIPEVITEDTGALVEFGNVPGIADACIAALRRPWRQESILDRAQMFSYPSFRQRLGALLDPA